MASRATPPRSWRALWLVDRGLLPHAQVGLPRGGAAVRAARPPAAVPGGVPDRGLADAVRVPAGPGLPGHRLRGGLRAGGMEGGVPGGVSPGAAAPAAAAGGDG